MRAIEVIKPGGAEQLRLIDRAIPQIKADEILIEVKATALNRLDILHRESGRGSFPSLGVEAAGVVVDTGSEVMLPIGTDVYGLTKGGSYAEYAVMPASWAMIKPEWMSFEMATAIPEVFLTAYQTLFSIGHLKEGETVLIHAGASGVGTAAIQLAKKLRRANIIVTVGSESKQHFCEKLGADIAINYKKTDFSSVVQEITQGNGVDLIIDLVGASNWERNITSMAVDGRWVVIGTVGGHTVKEMHLSDIMNKRIQLTGTLLTPRSDAYKTALVEAFSKEVGPLIQTQAVQPIIDQIFSFEEVSQAHQYMTANKNIGKIILQVAND